MKANLYPIFLCAVKVTDFVGFYVGKKFFFIELSFNGVKCSKMDKPLKFLESVLFYIQILLNNYETSLVIK